MAIERVLEKVFDKVIYKVLVKMNEIALEIIPEMVFYFARSSVFFK